MPDRRLPIKHELVFKSRNVELGIDPYCHECTSHKARHLFGYVMVKRDGFRQMHRWLWWQETGEKPEVVMHLCDNPSCINIAHLKAGTFAENNHDMSVKGRAPGALPVEIPHGTHGGYVYHKCRCALCTKAHAECVAEYRLRTGKR